MPMWPAWLVPAVHQKAPAFHVHMHILTHDAVQCLNNEKLDAGLTAVGA